ncbi:MAG: ATPase domain-containing protein, partial [Casimicrobium sp.]
MSKLKSLFVCRECGASASKWQGQCSGCNAWNTLEETRADANTRSRAAPSGPRRAIKLSEVSRESIQRWPTGLPEFDRALGGGLVPGGVILLGGDPGIGKSTLTLQAVAALASSRRALYVSGEESAAQVASRGERLGLDLALIDMLAETSLSAILSEIQASQP